MANRDFNKIERIMKDFSLNIGGSGSGGMVVVDKLPEKGNTGTLYRTSDGIYEWYHTEKQVPVYKDLEAGQSYTLKEEVPTNILGDFTGEHFSGPEETIINLTNWEQAEGDLKLSAFKVQQTALDEVVTYLVAYAFNGTESHEATKSSSYYISNNPIYFPDSVSLNTENIEGDVTFQITQELVDALATYDVELSELAFMIDLPIDHYDTIVDEGYIKIFGAIELDYNVLGDQNWEIYLDDKKYDAKLIYDTVKNNGDVVLYTYEKYNEEEFYYRSDKLVTYHDSAYYEIDELINNMTLNFYQGTSVDIYLKNQFEPAPATYTGQELINQVESQSQGSGSVFSIDWYRVNEWICRNLEEDELNKSLNDENSEVGDSRIIASLYDGALKLELRLMSDGKENTYYDLYVLTCLYADPDNPIEKKINSMELQSNKVTFNNILNIILYSSVFQRYAEVFKPTTNYSTNIIITFGDDTTKTISEPTNFMADIINVAL